MENPDSIHGAADGQYIAVDEDEFVDVAIRHVTDFRPAHDEATVYYVYVTDDAGRLVGVVSFRELLNADPDDLVSSIMETDVVSVRIDDHPEDVGHRLADYDYPALPVIGADETLIGVIRSEEMLDVMEAEASEDIFKHAGFSFAGVEVDRSAVILESTVSRILRLRLQWLVLALAGGLLAGGVIERYEATLEASSHWRSSSRSSWTWAGTSAPRRRRSSSADWPSGTSTIATR